MDSQQRQQIKKYIDLIIGRWRLILTCLLIFTAAGFVNYLRTTKVYQSTALLSYERQRINPSRMAPEEEQRLRDTVSTLSQLVMSRSNLEGIINQFSLYEQSRQRLPIDDVIEGMRRHIHISPSNRGDTFTVGFSGTVPEEVMKVTNALAAKFIEENLKYREERATETSKYKENELAMAKERLDAMEQTMRDYKLKYYNEMPEQRESNLAMLTSLSGQYQNIQTSIQDLERTKVMAQEQISLRSRMDSSQVLENAPGGSTGRGEATTLSPYSRLQRLRAYLDSLEAKYTDKHPEVRRTKQLIAALEKEVRLSGPAQGQEQPRTSSASRYVEDPEIGQLRIQIKDIDRNVAKLHHDQDELKDQISTYQQWIASAPVREAEWNALTRDYDELRRHYDYLVSQNLQAESVEHLERKQKGSKFKIVDPARLPDRPFQPEFLRAMLMAVAAGLALGIGLTLGLDFIDTSFRDPADLEGYLDLPVVCSIPVVELERESRRSRVWLLLAVSALAICWGVLLIAMAFAWTKGMIVL
jgi:polysaccharide biosynthesis transport protein